MTSWPSRASKLFLFAGFTTRTVVVSDHGIFVFDDFAYVRNARVLARGRGRAERRGEDAQPQRCRQAQERPAWHCFAATRKEHYCYALSLEEANSMNDRARVLVAAQSSSSRIDVGGRKSVASGESTPSSLTPLRWHFIYISLSRILNNYDTFFFVICSNPIHVVPIRIRAGLSPHN